MPEGGKAIIPNIPEANMFDFLKNILKPSNEGEIKKVRKIVDQINALEPDVKKLTDDQMREKIDALKQRAQAGEDLDALLPETYALVREAGVRVLNQRAFDVQLIGGVVLHQGRIAEMRTGEGKTLTATFPAVLNALTGRGVHVVTVNDYLAKFQSEWMGKVYRFLGLSVGLIVHDLDPAQRQAAYNSDITYGTNNEFGFDYLRDNMVTYKERMVQRPLNFAIVDEVDSILIDEARTPLIISGQGDKSTELYARANQFILTGLTEAQEDKEDRQGGLLVDGDYLRDEKDKTLSLTERGVKKAERFFNVDNLTDPENQELYHHILGALRAHKMMKRDVDYVVKDGQVIIVDEFTGRLMVGRRYSDGLHQAIEAKEGVKVERESKTLATITFQNYFRMYHERRRVRDHEGQVCRHHRGGREAPRHRPAGAGRHGFRGKERAAQRHAGAPGRGARGAERQVPREGSRDRGPGRQEGRRDHRHQHGRPRHRHPAGRQR